MFKETKRQRRTAFAVGLAALLVGCFDLNVPGVPQAGSVVGSVDTQGKISPANLDVTLLDDSGQRRTVKTGADGAFRFEDAKPQLYALELKAPGFAPLVVPSVRVRAGQPTDVGVLQPVWLQGSAAEARVYGKVTAMGGGEVTGATVEFRLQPGNDLVSTTVVGFDGAFEARLPPGTYNLKAQHPNYQSAEMRDVVVQEGAAKDLTATPLLLAINPATISGRLFMKRELLADDPAAGASVTVVSNGANTTAGMDGRYMLSGLPAGDFELRVTLQGYVPVSQRVTLRPGQTTMVPNLTLDLQRGTITGTVELSDRQPVDGTTVTIQPYGYSAVVSAGSAEPFRGTFVITGVNGGVPYRDYVVTAFKQRYLRATANVTVNAPTAGAGNLVLAPQTGDFAIDDGDPNNTPGFAKATTVTLRFTTTGSAPAFFRASESPSFAVDGGTAPYQAYTGDTQPFTLTGLDGNKTVFVQMKDMMMVESPVLSASITLDTTPPTAPQVQLPATGANGAVRFTNLPGNSLTVQVVATDLNGIVGLRLADSPPDGGSTLPGPSQAYVPTANFTRPAVTLPDGGVTFAGDGPQMVCAQVFDNAGNASAVGCDTIVIDRQVPSGSLTLLRGSKATADGVTNQVLVDVSTTAQPEPNGGAVFVRMANSSTDLSNAVLTPLRTRMSWFLDPIGEGVKTVHYQLIDAAGNAAPATNATITYDVSPPAGVGLSVPASSRSNTVSVGLTIPGTVTDLSSVDGVTVSESQAFTAAGTVGPQGPGTNPVSLTLSSGDGPKVVYGRFRDRAGNETIASANVSVDTTPPTGTFVVTGALADGTSSATLTTTTAVTVESRVSGAIEYLFMDSSSSACPSTGYLPLPPSGILSVTLPGGAAQGLREVRGCFRDSAGNTLGSLAGSTWAPRATITLDSSAPAGCAIALAGSLRDGGVASTGVTASAGLSVTTSGCGETPTEIALGTGPASCTTTAPLVWRPYAPTVSFSLPGLDGPTIVDACFRDAARNVGAATNNPKATITLDTTPPIDATLTLQSTNGFSRSLTVAATPSALGATEYALAQASNGPFTFLPYPPSTTPTVTFTGADGPRTVYAAFRDAVGNTSTVISANITVDTTAPTPPVLTLEAGGAVGGTKFTKQPASLPFTLTSSDATSGLAVMKLSATNTLLADGGLTNPVVFAYAQAGAFTRPTTGDGVQPVYVQVLDNAGNVSAVGTDTVVVDTAAPTGTMSLPRGPRATVNGFTNQALVDVVLASAYDGGVDLNGSVVTVKLANSSGAELDGAQYQALKPTTPWFLSSGEGLKTVYAVLKDTAGNTSSTLSATITYDVTAPGGLSVSIVQGAAVNDPDVTVQTATSATDLSPTQGLTISEDTSFTAAGTVGPTARPGNGQLGYTLSSGDDHKTVYVRFRDGAGNDAVGTASVLLDTSAPTGTFSLAGTLADGTESSTLTSSTSVTVRFNVNDATEYLLGNETLTICPTTGYTAMPASAQVATTLSGAATPRQMRACFRDGAANVLGPLVQTIALDGAAPTGCTLTLAGRKRDSSPAPAGRTALTAILVTTSGCSETPKEIALVNGTVSCSQAQAWQNFAGTLGFTLAGTEGPSTVSGCVRDAARNVGSTATANITLDTTPPDDASLALANTNGYAQQLTVNLTGAANGATEWAYSSVNGLGPWTFEAFPPAAQRSVTFVAPDGTKKAYAVFRDDVGNQSAVVGATVIVDTVTPAAPRLLSVDATNRSAHLFWDPVTDASGIAAYELWCGTTTPSALCATVAGNAPDGWVLNLANKRDQAFAVRAVDSAGRQSLFSATLTGSVGWKRIAVPVQSPYAIRPLDIATQGNDIYVTYMDTDVEWTVTTGTLKVAISNDRGQSWRSVTLDANFGWDRQFGSIGFSDSAVVIATIGADQSADGIFAGTAWSDRGQVRIWSSQDNGGTWTDVSTSTLPSTTYWARTSGLSLWTSGNTVGVPYLSGNDTSTNTLYLARSTNGGTSNFSLYTHNTGAFGTTYGNISNLRSCSGNYAAAHLWKEGSGLRSLTTHFLQDTFVDAAAGEAFIHTVANGVGAGNEVNTFDVACTSVPEAMQTYVVYGGTFSAGRYDLHLRRKLGTTSSYSWGAAQVLKSDNNTTVTPRIYAGGRNVYVLYRNLAEELVLGESTDEGATFPATAWTKVETGALRGRFPVMSGEQSTDVAIAYTDSTGGTLTALVPALRSVNTATTAGVGTSTLAWASVGGVSRYQIDSDAGSNVDTNFASVFQYDVPGFTDGGRAQAQQVRAVDPQGMPGNEGALWHMHPFTDTLVASTVTSTGAPSSSGGVVAYNQYAVLWPGFGGKPAAVNDLTVYRSSDYGATWAAHTPPTPPPGTTAARGFGSSYLSMVMYYRRSDVAGLRARAYTDMTAVTGPAETAVDTTLPVDHVAVKADPQYGNIAVAYSGVAAHQIGFAYYYTGTQAFTVRARINQPDATYSIDSVEVAKLDGSRVVVAWREERGAINYQQRILIAESLNLGLSWSAPIVLYTGNYSSSTDDFNISASASLSGANNGAYAVLAHVSEQNTGYAKGNNLFLQVTGTDHSNSSGSTLYYSKFYLDRENISDTYIDSAATVDGHYIAYQATSVTGTEVRLKLAYCAVDCHLQQSWSRSVLKTWTTSLSGKYTSVAVAQTSGAFDPRIYIPYHEYNSGTGTYDLRVMRGGVHRRLR